MRRDKASNQVFHKDAPQGGDVDAGSLLTAHELACRLGVTTKTVRNWQRRKKAPPHFLLAGTSLRFRKSDVDRWLELQRVSDVSAQANTEAVAEKLLAGMGMRRPRK